MSLLINNELIWVSVPKCASFSIEQALLNSNLDIKQHSAAFKNKERHTHIALHILKQEFGNKKSICIKRNWFERWLSSLQYILENIKINEEPIRNWVDVDNQFIYDIFTDEFSNVFHSLKITAEAICYNKFLKNQKEITNRFDKNSSLHMQKLSTLYSQNHWKENNKCDYEFDIDEMDKFTDFIEERFGEKLKINKLNSNPKTKSKIIINDELKSFVWNKFEKKYNKKNYLL
jgi:stress-induced morphogen